MNPAPGDASDPRFRDRATCADKPSPTTAHPGHDSGSGKIPESLRFACGSRVGRIEGEPELFLSAVHAARYLEGDLWTPIETQSVPVTPAS